MPGTPEPNPRKPRGNHRRTTTITLIDEVCSVNLNDHPTVRNFYAQSSPPGGASCQSKQPLDAQRLRQLCIECGADDAGLVESERPALDDQRDVILKYFPPTRTLLSFVCLMNRGPIRSPARSAANLEFHASYDHANDVAREVVTRLEAMGIRAMNPSVGFPMEMDNFPVVCGSFRTSQLQWRQALDAWAFIAM